MSPPKNGKNGKIGQAMGSLTRVAQIKSLFKQCRLDWEIFVSSLKISIPPTILVACIQSDNYVHFFSTNAYLAPILSVVAQPQLPRAKLIEANFRLSLSIAVGYCVSLFVGWCGLKARQNTITSPAELAEYNSSAEAVVALFLVVWIWLVYTLRSAFPLWTVPCQMAGIFSAAAWPPIARAPTMEGVIRIASVTLESFLAGEAVGMAVGLLIFPRSCRHYFMQDLKICLNDFRAIMDAQAQIATNLKLRLAKNDPENLLEASVNQLKAALQKYIASVAKLRSGSDYAEREFSYSRLNHQHLSKIGSLLVGMVAPLSGLSSAADMLFLSIKEHEEHEEHEDPGKITEDSKDKSDKSSTDREGDWHQLAHLVREQSYELTDAMKQGATHAFLRLGLFQHGKPVIQFRKQKADVENLNDSLRPGQATFLEAYQNVIRKSIFGTADTDTAEEHLLDKFIKAKPKIDTSVEITQDQYRDNVRYLLMIHVSYHF